MAFGIRRYAIDAVFVLCTSGSRPNGAALLSDRTRISRGQLAAAYVLCIV